MNYDPEQVGRAVRAVLEERKLSIREWAGRAGLQPGTLHAIIRGTTRSTRVETIYALADAAGVPIWRLLGETPPWADDEAALRDLLEELRKRETERGDLLDQLQKQLDHQTREISSSARAGGEPSDR